MNSLVSTTPNNNSNLISFLFKYFFLIHRGGLSKGLRGAIAQGHHMIGGTTWADCRINIFRINIIFLCGTYIYSPIILIHLTNTNFYGFLAYLHAGGKGGLFPAPRLFPTVLLGQRFGSVLVEYFCPPPDLVEKPYVQNLIKDFARKKFNILKHSILTGML